MTYDKTAFAAPLNTNEFLMEEEKVFRERLSRLRALAEEVKRAYSKETADGEPHYPTWVDDMIAVCEVATLPHKLQDCQSDAKDISSHRHASVSSMSHTMETK